MEKLSIIVPVMNGEATIKTCLDSLVNQTLQNIEIIVINDGSTDKTEEIVKSYEDERIRLISKENEGWGKAINQGIDLATGDYVGVLESDDRADLRAFEVLYSHKGEYDIIKAGWYDSYDGGIRSRKLPICREIIPDQEDIRVLSLVWEVQGSVWSGIYKKDFLDKNNIRCLETPGASYQDIAFSAKLWAYAKKILFLPDLLFFYTIDNPNQSTKDMKKVFCVKEEFNEIERICPEKYYSILAKIRYNIYKWNYMRLNDEGQALFIDTLKEDFNKDFKYADERLFTLSQWTDYTSMIANEQEDAMVIIGIPVYHSRETLPRALDSLVAQTKKMFMVAIVNDADGEDYSDIIEEYKNRGLKITYLVQEENKGPGAARQRVIDSCGMCEYVMFLDSDDMYSPIAVEVMTRAIAQNNLNIVMGNSTQLFTGKPAARADVSQTSITWVWNKIYRRSYLVENNIRFDESLRVSEDIAFSLAAWHGTEKKQRIDQDIYYWCDNKDSLTRKEGKTNFDVKYIDYFVRAQCRGLKKIYELTGDLNQALLTMTFINLYKQIQIALSLGAVEDSFIDELKSLKEIENVQKWKEDFMAWCLVIEKCPVGMVTDKRDIVFFKERFVDWINRVFYE